MDSSTTALIPLALISESLLLAFGAAPPRGPPLSTLIAVPLALPPPETIFKASAADRDTSLRLDSVLSGGDL